ncbi:hypothetical protein ABT282_08875 [Streptomyces sp. NPDC000927]|uniref:hypothetical protein n=1 Tax=Streptomyces sp. NPDC000927 TaxID=3154371 RepID=UPI0033341462
MSDKDLEVRKVGLMLSIGREWGCEVLEDTFRDVYVNGTFEGWTFATRVTQIEPPLYVWANPKARSFSRRRYPLRVLAEKAFIRQLKSDKDSATP